jgi:hypothetical protein
VPEVPVPVPVPVDGWVVVVPDCPVVAGCSVVVVVDGVVVVVVVEGAVVAGCSVVVVVVDGAVVAGCSVVVVVVDGAVVEGCSVVVVVDGVVVVVSVPVVAGGVLPPNQPAHHPINANTMMMPTTQAIVIFRFVLASAMSRSLLTLSYGVT